LDDSGDFAVNDYVVICAKGSYGDDNVWTPASSKIAKVTAVSSNTLTIDGSGLTVAVGDYALNIGADTGGTSPNFDGSDITLYDDPAGTTASTLDYLLTGSSAGFIGWVNRGAIECDLLITDSNDLMLGIEIAKPLLLQRVHYTYRGTRPTLTIDTGSAALPAGLEFSEVIIAAESGTTDQLDTLTGGVAGDTLVLVADSTDTITLSEDGNLEVVGTSRILHGATGDNITLRFDGTSWYELSFSDHM
jgi:hypothetical protein